MGALVMAGPGRLQPTARTTRWKRLETCRDAQHLVGAPTAARISHREVVAAVRIITMASRDAVAAPRAARPGRTKTRTTQ